MQPSAATAGQPRPSGTAGPATVRRLLMPWLVLIAATIGGSVRYERRQIHG
jgi:hypothetical protein